MARTQHLYGSRYHLLRYLGYHRQILTSQVEHTLGITGLQWLDCSSGNGSRDVDQEWRGLDFLPKDSKAQTAWANFWPQRGNVQNWDAVGWVELEGQKHWVIVEAKAHVGEIQNHCGAKDIGSLHQIERAFAETQAGLSIPEGKDWLAPYYQYCNRLAVLYFLHRERIPAHMVFLYFLGDTHPGKICPPDPVTWYPYLNAIDQHVGLSPTNPWRRWVHKVFSPAWATQNSLQPN